MVDSFNSDGEDDKHNNIDTYDIASTIQSPEEARTRIKEIMADPQFATVQTEFTRLPLYMLLGGSSTFLLSDIAIRRNWLKNITRPTFFKIGSMAMGALGALQIGAWRMKSLYQVADPTGAKQAELKRLFEISRSRKTSSPSDPPSKSNELS